MSTQPPEAPQQTPTDPAPAPQAPQNPTPTPPPNPPQNPSPQQTAAVASDATRNLLDARSFEQLRNEIQALPERIVNGIREATQAPQQPQNPAGGSANSGTPTATPGKRKSFADWWFNK